MAPYGNASWPLCCQCVKKVNDMLINIPSFLMVFFAVVAVSSRNSVHAVLALIMTFINAAVIFLSLGAEFVALMLIVVYVGAVAVLFLFVVMMLSIKQETHSHTKASFILPVVIGAMVITNIYCIARSSLAEQGLRMTHTHITHIYTHTSSNINQIAELLYSRYFVAFQSCGVILLLAMICTISILSIMPARTKTKRQNIKKQLERDPKKCIIMVNAKSGEGVDV